MERNPSREDSFVVGNSVGSRGWRNPSLPSPCCNSSSSRAAALLLSETQAQDSMETCFWQMTLGNFDLSFVQAHENREFMGESSPQTISLAAGTSGSGLQQCPVPVWVLGDVLRQQLLQVGRSPLYQSRKQKEGRHNLSFRIAEILQSNDFSWIYKHLAPLQAFLLGTVDIKWG